jgi:hypothetical protein
MAAPNKFGSNLSKAQVVYPVGDYGEAGGIFITDTNGHDGQFRGFEGITAGTATFVTPNLTGPALTNVPFAQGQELKFGFTRVTLLSGSGIAKNA